MSKDRVLFALEKWLMSEECFKQFCDNDEAAEEFFWDNLDGKFADWC